MKKFNILKDKNIDLTRIDGDTSCSMFKESSTFLRSAVCRNAKMSLDFNFISTSEYNIVSPFYITVTAKRFNNIYYGYDSTSFCLLRHDSPLKTGTRYLVYGKLSRIKTPFIDCLEATPIDYKALCYYLL